MIDKEVFQILRTRAIRKLPKELQHESFGYHIDVVNDWEIILNTNELKSYLGIHFTHESKFSELVHHLGKLTEYEERQAKAHLQILNNVQKLINTTPLMHSYKFDLMELVLDWRVIRGHIKSPRITVDFGAGCGRQAIGVLHSKEDGEPAYYLGVDASLNGYTTQNILYGVMAVMHDNLTFWDLLDYEADNLEYPELEKIGNRFNIVHFPAWTNYDYIPDYAVDLIIAAHVHNEISGADFDRLVKLVVDKLSKEGIFYVRSELGVWQDPLWFDSVLLHAKDLVQILAKQNIRVVDTIYLGGFQTTVFSRNKGRNSANRISSLKKNMKRFSYRLKDNAYAKHKRNNRVAKEKILTFKDATFFAAHNFMIDQTRKLVEEFNDISVYIDDFPEFNDFIKELSEEVKSIRLFGNLEEFTSKISDYQAIVISSQKFGEVESKLREIGEHFNTRIQYTYPVVFLMREKFDRTFETIP